MAHSCICKENAPNPWVASWLVVTDSSEFQTLAEKMWTVIMTIIIFFKHHIFKTEE